MKYLFSLLILIASTSLRSELPCISNEHCWKAQVLKEAIISLYKHPDIQTSDYHYRSEGLIIILGELNTPYSYSALASLSEIFHSGGIHLDYLEKEIFKSHDKQAMVSELKNLVNSIEECLNIEDRCIPLKVRKERAVKWINELETL